MINIRLLAESIKIWLLKFYTRKEAKMMAKIYFNRLLIGTIVYDAIPARYQDAVIGYGREYVKKGKLSEEEFEMLFKEPYEA